MTPLGAGALMRSEGIAMRRWIIGVVVCVGMLIGVELQYGDAATRADPGTPEPLMRVYFVPFDFVTYFPISMANIDVGSTYVIWFVDPGPGVRHREHPFISKLRRELQSRPITGRQINDYAIRLRVEVRGQTFFADAEGTVLEKVSGKTFLLSKVQKREIEKDIIYFSGVVDINAGKKLVLFPD